MKSCIVIYERADLEKNRFFAETIRNTLNARGFDASITVPEALPVGTPDFVVNRTRNFALAESLSARGARVFNSSTVCRLGNDKRGSFEYLSANGIPMLDCTFFEAGDSCSFEHYPCVAKPAHGRAGTLVSLCGDARALEKACAAIFAVGDIAVVQPLASSVGTDLRCYLLGGKLLAAVKRSSATDFRANYSLGADCARVEPGEAELSIVRRVNELLRPDFIGVDIIYHNGKPLLNEIEDAVGCRMLYKLGICDAAALYAEYIAESMS